jgi:hypothetical protein
MTLISDLEEMIEENCKLVDEFALQELTPNTPIYNFQQSLIANVKRYREAKKLDEEMWKNPSNCHSYIPGSKL